MERPFPRSASASGVLIPHIPSTAVMKTTAPLLVASLLSALSATGQDTIPITVYGGSTDFENIEMSDVFFSGNVGQSSIESDASVSASIPAANRPMNFTYAETREKVLCVDTAQDAPLFRNLNQDAGSANVGYPIYADFLIKGAAHKKDDVVLPTSPEDKILVYFRETEENGVIVGTNLYVRAAAYECDFDEAVPDGWEYKLETPASVGPIQSDTWYRIVLVAIPDVGGLGPGFEVHLGGYGEAYRCIGPGLWWGDSVGYIDDEPEFSYRFISLTSSINDPVYPGTMKSIGFAGSVLVDDFVVSSADPGLSTVTLNWPEELRMAGYAVGTETNELNVSSAGSLTLQVPVGSSLSLFGWTYYRHSPMEYSITADTSPQSLSLPAESIAWYFPQTDTPGQDGSADHPFEIASAFDLCVLADAVDAGFGAELCYVQTADISFADEGAFAGIGFYDEIPTNGVPFTGTYDGDNHRISNVTFTDRKYAGIFNQVNGGTIKNLTVKTVRFVGSDSEYSASIVGNAGNGATLQNLVAEGFFGLRGTPGTHNMAGIAIRLSGGGAGTFVKDCTNNATIYGTYTKLGGICALTQTKIPGGPVTFDGCANNGALRMPSGSTAGRDGLAGIVAYAADATILVNCSNTGEISSTLGSAKIGELVGYSYAGKSLTDEGGNSGNATRKLVDDQSGTITGFKFATVDNGVATTVLPPLATGNTYLLEGNVPASETPVATLTTVGDTIAFDMVLGYTFAGTIAVVGEDLTLTEDTVDSVTTYTADWMGPPPPTPPPYVGPKEGGLRILDAVNDAATYAVANPGSAITPLRFTSVTVTDTQIVAEFEATVEIDDPTALTATFGVVAESPLGTTYPDLIGVVTAKADGTGGTLTIALPADAGVLFLKGLVNAP